MTSNTIPIDIFQFLTELDKLKEIYRKSYVCNGLRRENSAEHSWHIAIAIWFLSKHMGHTIDTERAIKMALVHDICEIDAGDTPIYSGHRESKFQEEQACIDRIIEYSPDSLSEIKDLWLEYENNQTIESKWVKVADRLLPFLHNISSSGKTWREQNIKKSQVLAVNQPINKMFPQMYAWIEQQVDIATTNGWLIDA